MLFALDGRGVPGVALADVAELAALDRLGVVVVNQPLPLPDVLLDSPRNRRGDDAERVVADGEPQ